MKSLLLLFILAAILVNIVVGSKGSNYESADESEESGSEDSSGSEEDDSEGPQKRPSTLRWSDIVSKGFKFNGDSRSDLKRKDPDDADESDSESDSNSDEGGEVKSQDTKKVTESKRLQLTDKVSSGEETDEELEGDTLKKTGALAASFLVKKEELEEALKLVIALDQSSTSAAKLESGVLEGLSRYLRLDSVEFLQFFEKCLQSKISGDALAHLLNLSNLAFAFPTLKGSLFGLLRHVNDMEYLATVTQAIGDYFGWEVFHESIPKDVKPEQLLTFRLMTAINTDNSKEVESVIKGCKVDAKLITPILQAAYNQTAHMLPGLSGMWEIIRAIASKANISEDSMKNLAIQHLEQMSNDAGLGLREVLINLANHCPSDKVKEFVITQMARRDVSSAPNALEFMTSMMDDDIPLDFLDKYTAKTRRFLSKLPELSTPEYLKEIGKALANIKSPETFLSSMMLCRSGGLFNDSNIKERMEKMGLDDYHQDMVLVHNAIQNNSEKALEAPLKRLAKTCPGGVLEKALEFSLKGGTNRPRSRISKLVEDLVAEVKENKTRGGARIKRGSAVSKVAFEKTSGREGRARSRLGATQRPKKRQTTSMKKSRGTSSTVTKSKTTDKRRTAPGTRAEVTAQAKRDPRKEKGHSQQRPRFWVVTN